MRVHANFAEYVPFALVLLALAESLKVPSPLLHSMGLRLSPDASCMPTGCRRTRTTATARSGESGSPSRPSPLPALICFGLRF